MDDLTNKVALVTGGGRGIGRAIALALGRAGVDVVINYRSDQQAAHAVVAELQALGRRALPLQADVSRNAEVTRLIHQRASSPSPPGSAAAGGTSFT